MSEQAKEKLGKENWYAASAIFVTRWKDAPDECPAIEERVYLVQGTDDTALKKAVAFAKAEEITDYSFEYEDRLAREEFVGIRKLITVRAHVADFSPSETLGDGSELTFSYFKLVDKNDLQALIDGDMVRLIYIADPRGDDA